MTASRKRLALAATRLTEQEAIRLREAAGEAGLSVSAFLRGLILRALA